MSLKFKSTSLRRRSTLACLGIASGLLVFLVSCSPKRASVAVSPKAPSIIGGRPLVDADAISRSILYIHNPQTGDFCTGVLIGRRTVLTASHCAVVADFAKRKPVATFMSERERACGSSKVDRVALHPKRTTANADNRSVNSVPLYLPDLALLRLESDVCGSSPVALAVTPPRIGSIVQAAGFGTGTKHETQADQIDLRLLDLEGEEASRLYSDIEDPAEFMSWFQFFKGRVYLAVPADYHQALCFGDSGGPVYQTINGKTVLVGLISQSLPHEKKGHPRCELSYLALPAPIAENVTWIREILRIWRVNKSYDDSVTFAF